MTVRSILHVDMDAFYASVEQRDNPELRGKPLVVGGTGNRGVVAAASYESRRYGVRSAMPMAEARRRCPELLSVRPRMAHYKTVSGQIFEVFREFTPLVEGLSLDEAFLDVTASLKLFGSGERIARDVKERIKQRTALTASVGVAENKLVAKIASDLDKPDGLVVVTADNSRQVLDPLPVSVIPGIGRETLSRLHAIDVRTVGDLRTADDARLEPIFGRYTARTRARAAGIDDRPVEPARGEKSISAEETYDVDLSDPRDMERELLRLTERASRRMRKAGLAAGTVQVKIREADFTTYTRQKSLTPPGNGTDAIYQIACDLLMTWLADHPGARLRLLGVGGSKLSPAEQRDLFADVPTVAKPVDATVDAIRERFGTTSVGRAATLGRKDPERLE
ncbi:MAG: DNA polymerase IV [Woeseiaceae bacterium]|nr:DNA polymerase IV [Woeseiaceae bacterium]